MLTINDITSASSAGAFVVKKGLGAILAATCLLGAACSSQSVEEGGLQPVALKEAATSASTQNVADKPNVLVLMFDDMRFDTFSYRGGPVPTPNIDALAAQSTRFDMAMTTTGLCSPSRAAFFTGRWGHRTGLDDNVALWHSRQTGLRDEEGGIIKRASDAGYYVGYVGKWHLGPDGMAKRGAEFVDTYKKELEEHERQGTPYGRMAQTKRYLAGERDENGEKNQYYLTLKGDYEDTEAAQKVRAGQELIKSAAKEDRPFFGVISFSQPHPPYRVPEPYASMFPVDEIDEPANYMAKRVNKPLSQEIPWWPWHEVSHMTDNDWRESRAHYYGAIAMLDRAVGEIIQTAKDEGIWDDLHIVFIGDQGSMIGEHGLYDKAAYAYDELMRIPLLVRDPDVEPRVVNRIVSLMDVPVTMAEWMDLKPDGAVDGDSLTPLMLKGDSAITDAEDDALYAYEWYNGAWFGLRAIRTQDYKYVWNPGDERDELYDLKNDPGEIVNQIDNPDYKAKLLSLRKRLELRLLEVEDPSVMGLQRLIELNS